MWRPRRTILLATLFSVTCILGASRQQQSTPAGAGSTRAEDLAAWQQIYSVMSHPRRVNCHTAGNYPQQGDDRHRHLFNVVRGPEGKGVPALQCANGWETVIQPDAQGVLTKFRFSAFRPSQRTAPKLQVLSRPDRHSRYRLCCI
jgi:hypothetical protein